MPTRFDHVTITASDFATALRFYDATMAALGLRRLHELGDEEEDDAEVEAAAYGLPDGTAVLWLVAGPAPTASAHVAFRVDSRADVEHFHTAALGAGGTSRNAPRRWPIFRRGEFNAVVADPDGNLIEAIAPE